jgi:hypothetical protein
MNTDLTKTEGTEQKQVEKRTLIGAHIVLEAVRHEGEEEFGRSSSALAWSGRRGPSKRTLARCAMFRCRKKQGK